MPAGCQLVVRVNLNRQIVICIYEFYQQWKISTKLSIDMSAHQIGAVRIYHIHKRLPGKFPIRHNRHITLNGRQLPAFAAIGQLTQILVQ